MFGGGGGLLLTSGGLSRAYATSLDELSKAVPGQKIHFLKINDAYHLKTPMNPATAPDLGLRPRGRWSYDETTGLGRIAITTDD